MREPSFGQALWYYVSGMEAPEKYIFECIHNDHMYQVIQGVERKIYQLHSIGFHTSLANALKEQKYWDTHRLEELTKALKPLNDERGTDV